MDPIDFPLMLLFFFAFRGQAAARLSHNFSSADALLTLNIVGVIFLKTFQPVASNN